MAASAKRKQEEKHLKILREMTSLAPNRQCFDCDQRGPTYANMTVGSFVCTSCSGILRGLNPPHRVKSISMTTFTQQEIEFLQKHGNEGCKQIWLGLYEDRTLAIPDFREPQKVKEFLQDKYEKKRWYVPPEQAKTVHASISGSSASSTSSTPEVRPLKTLLGESVPSLHLNKNTPSQSPVVSRTQLTQQQYQERKFDLLSDLGGDIFAPPHSQSTGNANFANFAHFNSHSGANSAPPSAGVGPPPPQATVHGSDRYTALGQLENIFNTSAPNIGGYNTATTAQGSMFGSSTVPPAQTQQGNPSMPQGFAGMSTNPFVAPVAPQATPTNPFQTNGRAAGVGVAAAGMLGPLQGEVYPATLFASFGPPSMSMPTGFGNTAAYNLPTSFSGNFQPPFPGQPFTQPQTYPQQPNGGFAAFGQGKVTQFGQNMAAPGVANNPFLAGAPSAQFPAGGSSTNPFL
ncbi:arf-GAP domain and FG repeat-containing protein 1-like isoform X5 [Xyrauchen texanus]|uniref:arf-GAP domain and FG repeat-containing protein 1-like isoform X5 n=1 Tax=Xyrauchen texanus TaxID=154827 RepID=UPI002241FE1F|nr:arf-GAP domain and FG repeat-containing protein 1-like isoform X5 [Xyrauchen texanus]